MLNQYGRIGQEDVMSQECKPECKPDPEEMLQRAKKAKQKAELIQDNLRIFIESTEGEYFGDDSDRLIYQLLGKTQAMIWEREKQEQFWLDEIDRG